jgi:hypothetical protein
MKGWISAQKAEQLFTLRNRAWFFMPILKFGATAK